MTKQKWLESIDLDDYLKFLWNRGSARKKRLLAVSCTRRVWSLLTDKRSRQALETAEQFADGLVQRNKIRVAKDANEDVWSELEEGAKGIEQSSQAAAHAWAGVFAAAAVVDCCARKGCHTLDALSTVQHSLALEAEARRPAGRYSYEEFEAEKASEAKRQLPLVHDIFGYLVRSNSVSPPVLAWNDGTIPKLAQAIYDDRAFDRLPILADALEESGCSNQDILDHCRGPGPHVRGCWVVDSILGKT